MRLRSTLSSLRRALVALVALTGGGLAVMFLGLAVVPQSGLYATFTVLSASMEPAVREGSVVVVVPVDPAALRVGDVISFTSQQPPYPTLTHRVVRIDRTASGIVLQTKGDANADTDPWQVQYGSSGGRVVLAVPLAGYLMAASTSPMARAASGGIFLLVVGGLWLSLVWKRTARARAPRLAPAPAAYESAAAISLIRVGIFAWLILSLATGGQARRLAR